MAVELARELSVGDVGGADHDTLVIGGIDLVIPMELDLDDDPLQDDQLSLVSETTEWQQTLTIVDEDVTVQPESRRSLFRFRDVPYGIYRTEVCIARQRVVLHRGIIVRAEGAFLGDRELGGDVAPAPGGAVVTDLPPAPTPRYEEPTRLPFIDQEP